MRLAIVGAGSVGRAVLAHAPRRGHSVVAVADSSSAAVDADGLDAEAVLAQKAAAGQVGSAEVDALFDAPYDVLVEATPTTLGTAEPAFGHLERALTADRDVVLANKGPVAERYAELQALAEASAGRVRFEATVAGAIPVMATIAAYGPTEVTGVRGILNGTANFILSRMASESLAYDHVLAEAQELGVAEADPSFDVDGTDAALKCVIIANVLAQGDRVYQLADADVTGIAAIPTSAHQAARDAGMTIRLIGEVGAEGVRVGPRLVPHADPLAVTGTENIVRLELAGAGPMHLAGRGAGGPETAAAVLADIARLAR
ncbi:MAG: homoserine dehydrogenase [Haloquadratum sp.]|jgi:homoserine dehydrogenase|nr:homoserine dehydrogenase [Haloferacaceae archaeon]MDR9445509.1 homoserine dehydrogenase [Haloquadratum sp.]